MSSVEQKETVNGDSNLKKASTYVIDNLITDAYDLIKDNPYIKCIFWGPPESGKTYCATTFPGPITYIDLDGGLTPNLKYLKDKDGNSIKEIKRITCVDMNDDITEDPNEYSWKGVDPINTLRNFDAATSYIQSVKGGTVVVDTMSAYNEWLKMIMESRGPKKISKDGVEYIDQIDWKFVNQRWQWSWEKLKNVNANLVVVAKEQFEYQGREPTGMMEPNLRAMSNYNVDIVAKFDKVTEGSGADMKIKRVATFSKFRGNKFGTKAEIEDCTYDKIIEVLKKEDFV